MEGKLVTDPSDVLTPCESDAQDAQFVETNAEFIGESLTMTDLTPPFTVTVTKDQLTLGHGEKNHRPLQPSIVLCARLIPRGARGMRDLSPHPDQNKLTRLHLSSVTLDYQLEDRQKFQCRGN